MIVDGVDHRPGGVGRRAVPTRADATTTVGRCGLRADVGNGQARRIVEGSLCDIAQPTLAMARVVAQEQESLIDADAAVLRDRALGLLDDDPAVQCRLQLLGEDLTTADSPSLEQPDGRNVRQGLHDMNLRCSQRPTSRRRRLPSPR